MKEYSFIDAGLVAEIRDNPIKAAPFAKTASFERAVSGRGLWREYMPAAYRVRMVRLPEGTLIPNRLEWSVDSVKAGKIVLIGTAGELWQVAPEKVTAKYRNLDGTAITPEQLDALPEGEPVTIETIVDGSAPHVWAFRTDVSDIGTVLTDWGAVVPVNHREAEHASGDVLVMDALPDADGREAMLAAMQGNLRTVNGVVFDRTYTPVA